MKPIPEADALANVARSGFWLLGARLLAMSIGLIGLPILMSALGSLQFGAWAVLLGGTFAFGTLELGMSSAVMRWTTLALMPEASSHSRDEISGIMSNSILCTVAVFGIGAVGLIRVVDPLAAWLQLPSTPWLSGAQCILLVYATVAVLALLRCAIAPLLATRRMATHSAFTLAQSIVGAAATWTVAWSTRRLDLVLIANAASIVVVQLIAAIWTHRQLPWRFSPHRLNHALAGDMLRYGSALQFGDLSSFVMYQFDKLIISGVVTPSEVAHYEVASRSAQALGNISTAPFVAFAPQLTERHGRREDPIDDLLRMMRITVTGVGLFMLLPLAVSPIGLFAWVGEVGYHAASVFAMLAIAVISTALILPLSMCAQAMGRPRMELARATGAMLINVPIAFALIHTYGKEGAALGTLCACLLANLLFARAVLRLLHAPASRILSAVGPLLWPIVLTTCAIAVIARLVEPWIIGSRWYMAPTAAALYAAGLTSVMLLLLRNGSITNEERAVMQRVPVLRRWFSPQSPASANPFG